MNQSLLRSGAAAFALLCSVGAGVALAQGATRVAVTEVVVATGVEDHEPTGAATSFSRGTPLYCFIRAQNRTGAEATLAVSWEAGGEGAPGAGARGGTRLTVPARPTFRTYARSAVDREPGAYRCVVRSEDGRVLGSADFSVN